MSTRSIMLSKNGSTSEPHQSKKWSTTCLRQKSIQPPSVLASSNRCASKNRLVENTVFMLHYIVRPYARYDLAELFIFRANLKNNNGCVCSAERLPSRKTKLRVRMFLKSISITGHFPKIRPSYLQHRPPPSIWITLILL